MSSKLDIKALYGVLHIHLASLCNGRAWPHVAPPKTITPFVVYSFLAGGEEARRKRENSTLTLAIKCVAEHLEDALDTGQQIRDLLRDQGEQEGNTLPSDSDWHITTVSQGALIDMIEVWEDGTTFYHVGHQYTFTMELRG